MSHEVNVTLDIAEAAEILAGKAITAIDNKSQTQLDGYNFAVESAKVEALLALHYDLKSLAREIAKLHDTIKRK